MRTKDKILQIAIELFNRNGVQAVTTNHIAKEMGISPGNLYFHYDNKEEILQEIFKAMCRETYQIWRPERLKTKMPSQFISENFELYWKYRFFHREIYSLRRKDPSLAKLWRQHIDKMKKLLQILYRYWVKNDLMNEIREPAEMIFVSESLLAMATTFLQFFESAEVQPSRKSIDRGMRHVARLLFPYATARAQEDLKKFIQGQQ